jgi:hypothetical protein
MNDTLLDPGSLIIRKSNGRMYSCPNAETLKKWIAEGRLRRDDHVSKKGDRWFRLGDSPDLFGRPASYPGIPHAKAKKKKYRDEEIDQIVDAFQRKRRVRNAALWIGGAALVAVALGYSLAMIVPGNNPLRSFAEGNGLLPGKGTAEEAHAQLLGMAQRHYDRGDIADHERAEDFLIRARALDIDRGLVDGELASVYASHAASMIRLSQDEELAAKSEEDPEAKGHLLRASLNKRTSAEELLAKARNHLADAERAAPASIATLRAAAAVARVSGDQSREPEATIALERVTELGPEDPQTLLELALAAAPYPDRADNEALELAERRIDRALALSPELTRARIHLARVHLARGSLDLAQQELEPILAAMPSYEEAQRLVSRSRSVIATEAIVAEVASP